MDILIKSSGAKATRRGTNRAAIALKCSGTGHDKECACNGIELSDQPEHASSVLDALGVALLNRGCLEEGARLVEQALKIRRKYFGDDHPLTAQSLNSYARVLRERGELNSAEETSQVALRINRNAFGNDSYPVAVSLVEYGVILLNQARFAEAEKAANEGLAILRKRKLDDTDPNTTRLMDIRGRAEAARGALDIAARTFEEIQALDKAQGANLPKTVSHLGNYASVKESQGFLKQAEAWYLKVIDAYANRLKLRCHPNLIDAYANLGSLYLTRSSKASDIRQAARYLKEALRLGLKVRGPNHVLVANDYSNVGRLLYKMEDRRGAIRHFANALAIYDRNVRRGAIAPTYAFIGEALNWLGRSLVEGGTIGEAAKAEPLLERAVTIWEAQGEAGRLARAAANGALGRALYLQDKDPQRARALLTESYETLSKALGEEYDYVQLLRAWLDELCQGSAQAA